MTVLERMGALLAWLGRHGTRAVAISMPVGIVVAPLGKLMRPYFAETVVVLLILSFLRVEPRALRAHLVRPLLLIGAALWTIVVLPLLVMAPVIAIDGIRADVGQWWGALLLAVMLNAVAPPTFSSPSLAALIGLNGAISLGLLIVCTALTPLVAPVMVAALSQSELAISPVALGVRLAVMLVGAAFVATLLRWLAGDGFIRRQAERLDGLSVIMLYLFALALMSNVLENLLARPWLVLGLIVLSFLVSVALSTLTMLVFLRAGWSVALTLGHSAGSRNLGLMLAGAAGAVPDLVWLYVGLAQLPIYLLPLPFKPLVRRLASKGKSER
jgi:hypothetical protein